MIPAREPMGFWLWQVASLSPSQKKSWTCWVAGRNRRGGDIWNAISGIDGALTAIGYGLLVLFFAAGIVKTCGSFTDMEKPEHALKAFILFALACIIFSVYSASLPAIGDTVEENSDDAVRERCYEPIVFSFGGCYYLIKSYKNMKVSKCIMKNKVLLIDDDKELCNLIKECIEEEEIAVDYVCSGDLAFQKVKKLQDEYSLVILDIMLPQIDGLTILGGLRKNSNIPVLMLTAKDEEVDKVIGLRMGADDYLTKPFGMNELKARVYSLIRRYTVFSEQTEQKSKIELKNLSINLETRVVHVDGKTIELTNKEFNLLAFLASHPGRAFTKKQIYAEVWAEEYSFDDNNLIAFISKLRKKIKLDESSPSYIQTIRGVGYRFSTEV